MKKFNFHWLLWTIIILSFVIGSTVAYAALTAKDEKEKFMKIANLETKIEEVFESGTEIVVGESVDKKVSIKNTGTVDQFVRVMIHPVISMEEEGNIRILPSEVGKQIELDINSTDWKLGEDGYYYYLKILKAGEVTESNLFSKVTLSSSLEKEYKGADLNITIKSEATITDGYVKAWWQGNEPSDGKLNDINNKYSTLVTP